MNITQKRMVFVFRVALGVLFLWSGVDKALTGFSAAEYLYKATGPLAEIFKQMAGNSIVDFLVVFGEIGIGTALVTGTLVRFAAYCGVLMMGLFYFSKFPPSNGLVNNQVMYALGLLLLTAFEAGQVWGGDRWLHQYLNPPKKVKKK